VITAVDTNILLDILIPGAPQGDISEKSLTDALETGSVIISEVVYAELAANFHRQEEIDRFMRETGIQLFPSGADALFLAGKAWRGYLHRRPNSMVCGSCGSTQEFKCQKCGTTLIPRQRVVADFIIGAHASLHADRLLTRDRGYYHTYFPDLRISESA
jgi:predicted nucleic acid-binding protein